MTVEILTADVSSTPPSAVVFDLDDTLYPYAPSHAAGLKAAAEKLKQTLGIEAGAFNAAYDGARRSVKLGLMQTASSHSRLLYFQRVVELLGLRTQVALTLELEQTYWRSFLAAAALRPGVEEVLYEIRARGWPIAVVTDLTAQIQMRKLVWFGIDRQIDWLVTSEEAGSDKAEGKPFRLLAEKLGPIAAERIWMIGDAECDIAPFRAVFAQGRAFAFKIASREHLTGADARIANFDAFTRWLAVQDKIWKTRG